MQGSRITAAADALGTAGDAVKSSLVGSFASLMESMDIMVNIGNEIAKARVHGLRSAFSRSYVVGRSIPG